VPLIPVFANEEIILKPKETREIKIRVPLIANKINLENLVIQGTTRSLKKGIQLPNSIIPKGEILTLHSMVRNSSDKKILMKCVQKIGRCYKVDDTWDIKALPETKQNT